MIENANNSNACDSRSRIFVLGVYSLIDHIITEQRLKINQKAWDEYSANMDFDRKLDAYVPWCEEQKMKNGWNSYYFPRI